MTLLHAPRHRLTRTGANHAARVERQRADELEADLADAEAKIAELEQALAQADAARVAALEQENANLRQALRAYTTVTAEETTVTIPAIADTHAALGLRDDYLDDTDEAWTAAHAAAVKDTQPLCTADIPVPLWRAPFAAPAA